MKKKFILLFLVGISIFSNAQQVSPHNKHWIFGYKAHFDFQNNYTDPIIQAGTSYFIPPSTGIIWGGDNTVTFGAPRSYATVSDNSGNFLFCSDGIKLYKKGSSNLTPFKVFSTYEDEGKSIILPKPNSPNTYCVFTNSTAGLNYFQVIANSSTNVSVDPNFTPINLLDHLGNSITYNTKSRKITSARHSNGKDYWLIVQIRKDDENPNYADYVYSYLVTCNGIINQSGQQNRPYSSIILPNRERYGEQGEYKGINLKISHANIENNSSIPEKIKLAMTYSRDNMTSGKNVEGVLPGEFNRTTGEINFNGAIDFLTVNPNFNTTSLEFSPNSNLLYVTGFSSIYQIDLSTFAYTELPPIATSNLFTELYGFNGEVASANFQNYISDIQIAPNNKIYATVAGRKHIAEITNPNSYGTAQYLNISTTAMPMLLPNVSNPSASGIYPINTVNGYTQYYFPQLVQKQTNTTNSIVANNDTYNILNRCYQEPVNVLENDLLNGSPFSLPLTFYTVNQIGTVSPSSGIGHLTLQNNGILSFGAAIAAGTYTLTYQICSSSPCGNCSNTATITVIVADFNAPIDEPRSRIAETKTDENATIKVTPNPSNGYFYAENLNTNQIKIYDSFGKFIKNVNVENKSAVIDLSDRPIGIYYLVFESENQKFEKRLIKN